MSVKPRLSGIPIESQPSEVRELLRGMHEVVVYQVPLTTRFRGVTERQGLLLRGSAGWGECAPFWDYGPKESSRWLAAAIEAANSPFTPPRRTRIPVNVTVPVVAIEDVRIRIENQPGCATAKVKVADQGILTEADLDRVAFVARFLSEKYGNRARVRIDANAAWSVDEAVEALDLLDRTARAVDGLEYAEQPCDGVNALSQLSARTRVPIAADESIRRAVNPLLVRGVADVAILKVAPLGGISRCLSLERDLELPTVVSSALDTSIGLATGVQLAASLKELDYACGLNTGSLLAADVVKEPLLSSADQSPGYLEVTRAEAIHTGELTTQADAVPETVIEAWTERLRAMTPYLMPEYPD